MKTNGTLDWILDSDMDSRRMCFEQGQGVCLHAQRGRRRHHRGGTQRCHRAPPDFRRYGHPHLAGWAGRPLPQGRSGRSRLILTSRQARSSFRRCAVDHRDRRQRCRQEHLVPQQSSRAPRGLLRRRQHRSRPGKLRRSGAATRGAEMGGSPHRGPPGTWRILRLREYLLGRVAARQPLMDEQR